ncbi:hypothetical protein N2152v2_006788 [Parachlorella kessleri]
MEGSLERQPKGEEPAAASNGNDLGRVMVSTEYLGATFLQRQLKDLLLPEQRKAGESHMPAPEPATASKATPSLLASLWPSKGSREACEPRGCPPAERPLNGTHPVQPPEPVSDGHNGVQPAAGPAVVAAAAALAEPSPAALEGLGQAAGSSAPDRKPDGATEAPAAAAHQALQHNLQQQQPLAQEPAAALASPPRPEPPNAQPSAQHGTQQQQQQQQLAQRPAQHREADGVAALEAIISRLRGLDTEGWFWAPVRDMDAPNYSKIIKKPMCFQVMLGKIQARQYVNWNEIVRDFELICSNAMKYNQKRSRIHKLALVMLRAGKKLLVELEPEGRRAVADLHAAAGQQQQQQGAELGGLPAAAAEPQDSQAVPSSLLRSGESGRGGGGMVMAGGGRVLLVLTRCKF